MNFPCVARLNIATLNYDTATCFNVSIERWDLLAQQVVQYQPASHRLQ